VKGLDERIGSQQTSASHPALQRAQQIRIDHPEIESKRLAEDVRDGVHQHLKRRLGSGAVTRQGDAIHVSLTVDHNGKPL